MNGPFDNNPNIGAALSKKDDRTQVCPVCGRIVDMPPIEDVHLPCPNAECKGVLEPSDDEA